MVSRYGKRFEDRGTWMQIVHLDLGMEYRGGQRQVLYLAQAQQAAG